MRKVLLFSVFSFLFAFLGNAQIASWSLTTDGNPSNVDANINAGVFKKGTGLNTLTFGTTGASCSGWTTTAAPDTADYFQISVAPNSGFKLKITALLFSERRSLTGIREYQVRISTTANFSNYTTLTTVSVPDDDLERDGSINGLNIVVNNGETLYIRWYGYSAEGSTGTWRINDNTLALQGVVSAVNTNDNDSYASAPSTQVAADTISSIRTSASLAKKVFSFVLNDAGTSDGLPTHLSTLSIKNANSINWQQILKGAFIAVNGTAVLSVDTTIGQSNINFSFNQGTVSIPNAGSVNIDVFIFLKDSFLVDGTSLEFLVDSTCFDSYLTGSGFASSFAVIHSNIFTLDVVGKKINILTQPSLVFPTVPFSFNCEVVDNNGNRDTGFSGSIQLQVSLGSGQLQSSVGLNQTATNGLVSWNDLTYSTADIFQILVSDANSQLLSAYSNFIYAIEAPTVLDEHFSDGDFSQNPSWVGSTGDFIINTENQLVLNTVASSSSNFSYLTTPVKIGVDSTEWQAYVYLNFSPSSNNNIKYYLMSNSSDLTASTLKGYYILIGEDGSSDAIKLYYQDGTTNTLLATGALAAVSASPKVRIKVIRTMSGLWRIYADYVGGSAFVLQATANETSFNDSIVFTGVICKYSSSYATNKFFFDDFYTGPVQVDTIQPTLAELRVLDSLHIDLLFTEGMSLTNAQSVNNYVVNNNIGVPLTAVRDNLNAALVHLTFATPFVSGLQYTIAFFNLYDLAGNMIPQPLAENFVWYFVQPFDVQINEIMADPSPAVQLPEYEYVELYNRSQYPIQLKDWTFTIGSTVNVLPSYQLPAGGYVILCHSSAVTALSVYGQALPAISSTTALTNSGTSIKLQSADGRMIHYVDYSDNWYQSSFKASGGWSLEQIDPMNPCGESANWIASTNVKGGTPGAQNSVYRSNPDNVLPDLLRAALIEPDTLILTFSETILDNQWLIPANFTVDHGIGNPTNVSFINNDHKKVLLLFNAAGFTNDTVYTVTVAAGVKDCAGNLTQNTLFAMFAIGDSVVSGSFIINEVLFYEQTGGNDYVELYNPTNHTYNLKDVKWAVIDNTGQISNLYDITTEGFYLFPHDYVVLAKTAKGVTNFYSTPYPKKILEMSSFPSLTSTSGRITFVNRSFEYIDDFAYNESMHFQLLNSFKGVSLERIHPELPTQDAKNWHSASQSCGFGTPTYQNSQYSHFEDNTSEILVEPEVFSPDMDGKDDVLNIHYKFSEPGYVANITIFDAKGREVKRLIRNEMCGIEGYFVWDGLTDAKTKAEIGIYIVYVEVFNLNGTTKAFKKTCVVGGYLR